MIKEHEHEKLEGKNRVKLKYYTRETERNQFVTVNKIFVQLRLNPVFVSLNKFLKSTYFSSASKNFTNFSHIKQPSDNASFPRDEVCKPQRDFLLWQIKTFSQSNVGCRNRFNNQRKPSLKPF